MGLYKLITEKYLNFQSDTAVFQGLLDHAEYILRSAHFSSHTDEAFIFFNNFVEDLGISKMCLLLPNENQFKMYFSYGFESESFKKAVSTIDFWEGTVPQDEWYSVMAEDIIPFRQLFSEDDNSEILILHIKRINLQSTSLIILIGECTKQSLVDTEMVDLVLSSLYPHIEKTHEVKKITETLTFPSEFDTAVNIENSLIENSKGFLFEISLEAFFDSFNGLTPDARQLLFNSYFYALQILIKHPDILFNYNGRIKVIRFSNNDIDEELYAYQLKKTLSPVFTPEKADLIEINCLGSSSETEKLTEFLQR